MERTRLGKPSLSQDKSSAEETYSGLVSPSRLTSISNSVGRARSGCGG
jgi:hypothetical protein